jgi:hypothetical protein
MSVITASCRCYYTEIVRYEHAREDQGADKAESTIRKLERHHPHRAYLHARSQDRAEIQVLVH